MNKRIQRLLGRFVLAGTLFQFPGCGMQEVTNDVVDAIKGGITDTTVGITEIIVESWLDTAFPTE